MILKLCASILAIAFKIGALFIWTDPYLPDLILIVATDLSRCQSKWAHRALQHFFITRCAPGPISIILNFPKKGWNQTAFLPKNWEVLIKIEGIQVISAPNGQNLTPCPRYLRVKTFDKTAKTENWLELEIAKLLNCQNWKLTRCQNWKLLCC